MADISRDNEDRSINAHDGGAVVNIADRAVSVVALVIACVALGMILYMPSLIDAKVQAGMAHAQELAHNADTNSRVGIEHYQAIEKEVAVLTDRTQRKEK